MNMNLIVDKQNRNLNPITEIAESTSFLTYIVVKVIFREFSLFLHILEVFEKMD